MLVASSLRSGVVVLCLSIGIARAQPTVPKGFTIELETVGGPNCKYLEFAPSHFGPYAGHVFASRFGETIGRIDPEAGPITFATFSNQPTYMRFWPGGTFPEGMYVTCFGSPDDQRRGRVVRITADGMVTEFGASTPPGFRQGGTGLAFSDQNGGFGRFLYTASFGVTVDPCICRMPPDGSTSELFQMICEDGEGFPGTVGGLTFGTGRAGFSTDLYFGLHRTFQNPPGPLSGVYRMDSAGNRTPLATSATSPLITGIRQIAFGPGGSFGDDLYAADVDGRILQINSAGNVSVFVEGIGPDGSSTRVTTIAFRDASTAITCQWGTTNIYWIRPVCPTDLDQSGDTGLQDLAILLSHFGMTGGATSEDGDFDDDEDVDLADLSRLLVAFGTPC